MHTHTPADRRIIKLIDRLRRASGWSTYQLSTYAGLHANTVKCNLLTYRHPPRYETVVALLAPLGVRVRHAGSVYPIDHLRNLVARHVTDTTRAQLAHVAKVPAPTLAAFLRGNNTQWRTVARVAKASGITLVVPGGKESTV